MDANSFRSEITAAWKLLNDRLSLGRSFSSPQSLPVDAEFRVAALDDDLSYGELYRAALSRSHYNFILTDYSFFQFSYNSRTSWRLAYYPNPWIAGAPDAELSLSRWEMMEETGVLSEEEVSAFIAEIPYISAIPPIRFEFADDQYREFVHPAAHFHIGRHTSNRWPSSILIGPKVFSLIIAKLYYQSAWSPRSGYATPGAVNCIEQALLAALGDAAAVLSFSVDERRSFHFGKNI